MDAFAAVTELPGVAEAADDARGAVDALLWDRGLRPRAQELVTRSGLAGAATSADLDGVDIPWAVWLAGQAGDGTPVGTAAAAVAALYQQLPGLRPTWETAPLQALARMHAIVASGSGDEPGRPRTGTAVDPLRLGGSVDPAAIPARLQRLAADLTTSTEAPALVVAAIVHAELVTLQPFRYGSGLVGRAAVRLVLATRGLDPDNWSVPEAGVKALGRSAYARAARGYARGDADGVAEWVVFHCQAVAEGTRGLVELLD